jgi:hypothetical protein
MEFIFMLTCDDRTVADAVGVYREIKKTGLSLVGFKDVGADVDTLRGLTEEMQADGRTVFLEVVSTSKDEELRSVEAALNIGVDYLMGGTNVEVALALIGQAQVRYCPFPGIIVGHPSELQGSIDELSADAARLTSLPGVHGLDLLAYRHKTVDPAALTAAVVAASHGPVIAAGSIDSEERIKAMASAGVWAFTIGGAIFNGILPGAPDLAAQIEWTLSVCG